MSILTEISLGEFLDKLTILRIKAERITDAAKLQNITGELRMLEARWREAQRNAGDIDPELAELRHVNEALWDIEDRLRGKEAKQQFDAEFIALARAVYVNNDRRAALKSSINHKLGSALIEEKSYTEYACDSEIKRRERRDNNK